MESVSINMHRKERDEIVKRILCYGDSNTWGYQAVTGSRYPEEVRWPCILQKLLGDAYHVYENGLNGRTTVFEDDYDPYRSGVKEIIPAIMVTEPLDLIVTLGGSEDPASAAQVYGELNAAVWSAMPILERLLVIPSPHIRIGIDFMEPKTKLEGEVGVTARIGTLLAVGATIGFPALKWFLQYKKKEKQPPEPKSEPAAA